MSIKVIKLDNIRIPKLRFHGFYDYWEEKRFGKVVSNYKLGGNYANTENITKYPLIKMGNIGRGSILLNKIEYIVEGYMIDPNDKIKKGDLFFNTRNTLDLVGKVAIWRNELPEAYYNSNLMYLKFDCNEFMNYYLNSYRGLCSLKSIATGTTSVAAIYTKDLLRIKLIIPQIAEQQKIGVFLESVDSWIENLKEQKESFISYKKGIIKDIFLQKIRFKDEDNKVFSKWESKKLSDIGKTYNGLQAKSGGDFGDGEPFITYKQIFDSSEIDIKKFALVKVAVDEKQSKAQFGDAFFTTSSETPEEVGFASILLDKKVSPYLNSFSFGFRPNSLNEFDPYFAKFIFRSPLFRKEIVKLAQGSTRYNISKIEFMKTKIFVPSIGEQQKIAEFLTSIDNIIDSKQQQIIQAEQWKRGLIQGLFV